MVRIGIEGVGFMGMDRQLGVAVVRREVESKPGRPICRRGR